MTAPWSGAVLAGALVAGGALAACGSEDTTATRTSTSTPAPATSTPAPATHTPAAAPSTEVNATTGPGPLSAAQVKALIVDFDARLANAYATGDTSHLSEFLAGPELTGNVGTINENNAHHVHNIFHVEFDSLEITSNEAAKVVFNLTDNTTINEYVDSSSGQVVNPLPGPEVQHFIVFFDYNPQNHTWYWTGAQKNPT